MKMLTVPGFDLKFSDHDVTWLMQRLESILRSGFISMGANVKEFEERFSQYCEVRHAIATANGTCSLQMILEALNVRGGTVVIPSLTYMASATAAVRAGARVVFVDSRPESFQMDSEDLERKVQPDTKAVVLVHMAGNISSEVDRIREFLRLRGIPLVEDAAHAHGATIDGRKAGSLGAAASFSFFSTKVMTTGEGGMVTTDGDDIAIFCKALRDHGRFTAEANLHDEFGYNWRPSELHAILGCLQMTQAADILERRRAIARRYDEGIDALSISGVRRLSIADNVESAYYKYVLLIDESIDRNRLKKTMKELHEVSLSGYLYDRPVHSQPLFDKYPDCVVRVPGESFPGTSYAVERHICLPLYASLTEDQIDYTVESLQRAVLAVR